MYAEDLVQTYAGPKLAASVPVSPCEPGLLDSVGRVLLVSSIPSESYNLSSPLPRDSLSSNGTNQMETSNIDSLPA